MKMVFKSIFFALLITISLILILTFWPSQEEPQNQKQTTEETLTECQKKLKEEDETIKYSQEENNLPVDFSNIPDSRTFRTVIGRGMEDGPDIAGHFVLASWGCGTDCFGYAVIDYESRQVLAYEPANPEYHLRRDYNLHDRYFVLDPLYEGEEVKYFKVTEKENQKPQVILDCTEKAQKDYYLPITE